MQKVVILTICDASSDENFIKTKFKKKSEYSAVQYIP